MAAPISCNRRVVSPAVARNRVVLEASPAGLLAQVDDGERRAGRPGQQQEKQPGDECPEPEEGCFRAWDE